MKSFCRSCLLKHLVNELLNQSPLIDMKVGCPQKKVCFKSVDTLKMNTQFTCIQLCWAGTYESQHQQLLERVIKYKIVICT